jgi:signal transduction histidine kinase
MCHDLLVLARVGRPDRPLDHVVDLVAQTRGVLDLLAGEADARDIAIELDAEPAELLVVGDVQDLDAVVSNLVANAVKYSEPGGRVTVSLHRVDQRVRIEVVDRGVGIGEEDRARVFEEFFRSTDPRVRQRPGTGLGLAIAERAVSRHGGTISVQSSPEDGTRFVVELPLWDG